MSLCSCCSVRGEIIFTKKTTYWVTDFFMRIILPRIEPQPHKLVKGTKSKVTNNRSGPICALACVWTCACPTGSVDCTSCAWTCVKPCLWTYRFGLTLAMVLAGVWTTTRPDVLDYAANVKIWSCYRSPFDLVTDPIWSRFLSWSC